MMCAMDEPSNLELRHHVTGNASHSATIPETIRRPVMSIAATDIRLDKKIKSFVKERRKLLIDGQWVDAASGKTFPVENPATGEVIAQAAEGDKKDIDRAVKAPRRAFESGPWPRLSPSERGRLVSKRGDIILENLEEFAELDAL